MKLLLSSDAKVEFPEKLEIIKDQNTILHDKFYEEMKKAEFTALYKDFVSNFISDLEIFKNLTKTK